VSGWPIDTNVISELRRPKPTSQVVAFIEAQPLESLFVRVVSFAEIRFGIERLAELKRRTELTSWLTHKVRNQNPSLTKPGSP
jgi:toxin FitB